MPPPQEETLETGNPPRDKSDYGSDFGEDGDAIIIALLEQLQPAEASKPYVLESIEENEALPSSSGARVPRLPDSQGSETVTEEWLILEQERRRRAPSVEVEYDIVSRGAFTVPGEGSAGAARFESPAPEPEIPDKRTPLERFRTAPKKPLSVTDIVSPAWCEIQYWYTLTKHGRKKRTPAMKQGSAVHKVLEEQVHRIVPVDVTTREDHWGLKIWNIIQGIRTLRAMRLTREFELWGVIDGQVVNGIIDELSFDCPDPEMEAALLKAERKASGMRTPPPDQSKISEYFASGGEPSLAEGIRRARGAESHSDDKVYLTDVKTRGSASIPKGPSLRPTIMQLHTYRRLLADLVQDKVDSEVIFQRYGLDSSAPFSDNLIAQLGNLDRGFESSEDRPPGSPPPTTDTVSELLSHNSLAELWRLMISQLQVTMPYGAGSISPVLRAEFRSARDGSVLGARTFPYNDADLQHYLDDELRWWRGEREPRGVDVEEAFKCRICEFAEGCTWRIAKVEEAMHKSSLRAEVRRKSEV